MKVELILPRKEQYKLKDLGCYIVPQTLTQLAAVTPNDVDLVLIDENLEDVNFDSGANLVGISVMTSQVKRAEEISSGYKARGAAVVWGGIHPTVVDQESNTLIDSYVVGEGDRIWPEVVSDFKRGDLKRRYENHETVDLNKTPLPRRDLLRPNVKFLIESTLGSRGCCYSCEHCSASVVYGRSIRFVEHSRVVEDIKNMASPIVALLDDNIINSSRYTSNLLNQIGNLGKQYFVQIGPYSALDKQIVASLNAAGVKLALIGFESVNPQNFSGNHKYVPPSKWPEIVANLHENDIMVDGTFMLGMDFDDATTFEKTETEVRKAGIDFFSPCVITPYPGTKLYERLKKEGRILHNSWEYYDLNHCNFIPKSKELTPESVEIGVADLIKRMHKSIFENFAAIFDA